MQSRNTHLSAPSYVRWVRQNVHKYVPDFKTLDTNMLQYKKSKELPKCTGLFLLDKPIEYVSDYPNVLRTSITVAINYYFSSKIYIQ